MGRHLGMFSAVPGGKFPHILCGSYSQECGRAAFRNSTNRGSTRYQFWPFIIQAISLNYYSCLCRRELNSDEQNSRFLIQGQLLCKDRSTEFYPLKSHYGNYTSFLYPGLAPGKILKLTHVLSPVQGFALSIYGTNYMQGTK